MVTTELQRKLHANDYPHAEELRGRLIPVYHLTDNDNLPSIMQTGLSASRDKSKNGEIYKEERRIVDGIIDRFVFKLWPGFSRTDAIYADLEPAIRIVPFRWQTTNLEVMVDPSKVLVVDQWYYDETRGALQRHKLREVVWNARQYWKTAVTLQEYRARGGGLFAIPEVIIPNPVGIGRLRVLND